MSVYTKVSEADLKRYLSSYSVGELQRFTGIRAGIENTNYQVNTSQGDFVLTLFEYLTDTEVNTSLTLMEYLAEQGLPCPRPIHNKSGQYLLDLHGKPTSLVTRLQGQSLQEITPQHCLAVGENLARLHLAGQSFQSPIPYSRGHEWRLQMQKTLSPHLSKTQQALLDDEICCQARQFETLPRGVIHADLFRDNVLFTEATLTGLLDLYDASYDLLLFDLAITATDWCSLTSGAFDPARLEALLKGYHQLRPISQEEQQAWPLILRRAALRFWLSRLNSRIHPRPGHLIQEKDPDVYQAFLEYYRQHPQTWPI